MDPHTQTLTSAYKVTLKPGTKSTVHPAGKTFLDLRLLDHCLLVFRNPFSHRTGPARSDLRGNQKTGEGRREKESGRKGGREEGRKGAGREKGRKIGGQIVFDHQQEQKYFSYYAQSVDRKDRYLSKRFCAHVCTVACTIRIIAFRPLMRHSANSIAFCLHFSKGFIRRNLNHLVKMILAALILLLSRILRM